MKYSVLDALYLSYALPRCWDINPQSEGNAEALREMAHRGKY
ncbi:hypothetical protein [Sodalis-like endosymbiont of Proechinophthirus fluctus]|nr:hypothetical protein [Sodalis-like endosymbiont of Proechinophthirus fluctus]